VKHPVFGNSAQLWRRQRCAIK